MAAVICLLAMLMFIMVCSQSKGEEQILKNDRWRWKREIPRGFPNKNKGKDLVVGAQPNVFPYYNNIPQIIYLAQPPVLPPQAPPITMEKQIPVVQPLPPPQPPVVVFQPPVYQPQLPSLSLPAPVPPAPPPKVVILPQPALPLQPVIPPQPAIPPRIILLPTTTTQKPPTTTTACPVTAPIPENPAPKLVCPAGDKLCYVNTNTDGVQYAIVNRHNNIRKTIKATNMLKMHWDSGVANAAQTYADQCSLSKQENLSISGIACNQNTFSVKTMYTWDALVAKWNVQRKQYKYGTQSPETLEYSHMITANSQIIGCAFKDCGPKGYFYVCNYCPAGPPNSQATPYISGTQCADCKCHCDNNLCLRIG